MRTIIGVLMLVFSLGIIYVGIDNIITGKSFEGLVLIALANIILTKILIFDN